MKITSLKKSVANLIAKVSYGEALKNANSTCVFLHGQPKLPKDVQMLINPDIYYDRKNN